MITTIHLSDFRPDLYKIIQATNTDLLIRVVSDIFENKDWKGIRYSDKTPLMIFIPKQYYTEKIGTKITDKYIKEMLDNELFIFDSGNFSWEYTCNNLPSKNP